MADAYGEPLNPKQERSYSLVACMPLLFRYGCRCLVWFVQVPCKVPEVRLPALPRVGCGWIRRRTRHCRERGMRQIPRTDILVAKRVAHAL